MITIIAKDPADVVPYAITVLHADGDTTTGVSVTATGVMVDSHTLVGEVVTLWLSGGTAGDIIFRDGGASGTIRLQFNVPANTNNPFANLIPGEGIYCPNGIFVGCGSTVTATVFYG